MHGIVFYHAKAWKENLCLQFTEISVDHWSADMYMRVTSDKSGKQVSSKIIQQ